MWQRHQDLQQCAYIRILSSVRSSIWVAIVMGLTKGYVGRGWEIGSPLTEPRSRARPYCACYSSHPLLNMVRYSCAERTTSPILQASHPLLCRLPLKQPQSEVLPLPPAHPMTGTWVPVQLHLLLPLPLPFQIPALRHGTSWVTPWSFLLHFSSVRNAFPSLLLIFNCKMPPNLKVLLKCQPPLESFPWFPPLSPGLG